MVFKADGLTVNYGETAALWDVTFSVPAGQMVAIVGPNGAGKSTLLKAALGEVRPASGSLSFRGQSVAYVPQRGALDWDFPITVREVATMGRYGKLGLFRWPRRADRESAEEHLEMVGLEGLEDRQIAQLSGGQQQRLMIARALMQGSDIFLLDEPFAGVDAKSEELILQILRRLRDEGKTVVVVHHDLATVERTFDWVLILNMRLVACGPIEEVFHLENVERAYGKGSALFGELFKLAQSKTQGRE
jgi:manganese/zinc/iron transport system ATP- binding protein